MSEPSRWHYTIGARFGGIMEDGVIEASPRPASQNRAHMKLLPGERRVVWFSIREDWEPTAAKVARESWPGELEAMRLDYKHGGGLFRIGVGRSVASVSWREYARRLKAKSPNGSQAISGLVRVAEERGAKPTDWFVHYGDVPIHTWDTLEEWHPGPVEAWRDGGYWKPTDAD